MATSFEEITREAFEGWLDTLGKRWWPKPATVGSYLIAFSNAVGLSVHSSIGSDNRSMGPGRGAMHMSMLSLVNGTPLLGMKAALGREYFTRTKRWEQRLSGAVDIFWKDYIDARERYESRAKVDVVAYKKEWLELIESIVDWEKHALLYNCHGLVSRGVVLSPKQEAAIVAIAKRSARSATQPVQAINQTLQEMRDLYVRAREGQDAETMRWTHLLAIRIKEQKRISQAQWRALVERFNRFRVRYTVPAGV